ncbi:hypothetical protein ABK040_016245 [Willaertia magna]
MSFYKKQIDYMTDYNYNNNNYNPYNDPNQINLDNNNSLVSATTTTNDDNNETNEILPPSYEDAQQDISIIHNHNQNYNNHHQHNPSIIDYNNNNTNNTNNYGTNEKSLNPRDVFGLDFLKGTSKYIKNESFWEAGFFGLNPFATKRRRILTELKNKENGSKKFKVMRTARGHPYLVKLGVNLDEVKQVQDEFHRNKLPFFSSTWQEIEDEFGLGVRLYFDFCKMMIVLNTILFFFQACSYIPNLVIAIIDIRKTDGNDMYGNLLDLLYASSFSNSLYYLWVVVNGLCILISIGFAPVYWLLTRHTFQKRDIYDMEEDIAEILDADSDRIKENEEYTTLNRLFRFTFSYSLFLIFMVLSSAATIGFTIMQNFTTIYEVADSVFSQNSIVLTIISLAISVLVSVINKIWSEICLSLTNFEKHTSWSSYRNHNTFKYLFFKLLNIFVMSFTKGLFNVPCVLRTLGHQYLIQILLDFVVFNIIELILPIFIYKIKEMRQTGRGSDEDMRPEFDVGEEYLEVIYRQYLIYCGFSTFPMITFISVLGTVAELYLDKFRLLKVCKKPPMTNTSLKTFVSFYLICIALLPIINWGGGNVYPMTGYFWCNTPNNRECEPCNVFAQTNYITNFINY